MEQNLENTIALLERTPAALDALLSGIARMWTQSSEGERYVECVCSGGTLIHGEHEDWIPRARMILESGGRAGLCAVRSGWTRAPHPRQNAGPIA